MTPLRNRMIQDLQLKGYSESTQCLYVNSVRQLCDHFEKPPGKITEEYLRDYFLHCKNVKNWSRSTFVDTQFDQLGLLYLQAPNKQGLQQSTKQIDPRPGKSVEKPFNSMRGGHLNRYPC